MEGQKGEQKKGGVKGQKPPYIVYSDIPVPCPNLALLTEQTARV